MDIGKDYRFCVNVHLPTLNMVQIIILVLGGFSSPCFNLTVLSFETLFFFPTLLQTNITIFIVFIFSFLKTIFKTIEALEVAISISVLFF